MAILNFIQRFKVYIITLLFLCFVYVTVSNFGITSPSYIKLDLRTSIYTESFDGARLPDDLEDLRSIEDGKAIFFLETSDQNSAFSTVKLRPRQACAVESAARSNPQSRIYVLFTVPLFYPVRSCSTPGCQTIKELIRYDNVFLRTIDVEQYFQNTPLEEWRKLGLLQSSSYPVEHTSDVLRYLTLWKFGGTYLDLDVVVLKSFESLGSNFAGIQTPDIINNAVINFGRNEPGHGWVDLCLREILTDYRGNDWGYNGPGVITRVMNKICKRKSFARNALSNCDGFKILPQSAFHPIDYLSWQLFFDEKETENVLQTVKDSYSVHLWNKMSHKAEIKTENKQEALAKMAELKCPNVFRSCGDVF